MDEELRDIHHSHTEQIAQYYFQIKDLADRVGYGNLMTLLGAMWHRKMGQEWGMDGDERGAFVPTCISFLADEDAKNARDSREIYLGHINKIDPLTKAPGRAVTKE